MSIPGIPDPAALQQRLRRLEAQHLIQAYDRILIDLHIRDGLPFREIARRLGRHPGSISHRWYRRIVPLLRRDLDAPRLEDGDGDDAA